MKLKILLIGLPGTGKTTWLSTVPKVAIAASETGHGAGLMSIAQSNIPFVTPETYSEFETFCSGGLFKDAEALAVDSLSSMTRTFIKDYAITNFPRARGETPKRRAGIPELDDYNTIGECARRLIAKLIGLDKHIIVTCTLKLPQEARPDEGKEALPAMPDLPGQQALAQAAAFDTVLIMRTRPALRDPKNAASRYSQRYFMTQQTDKWLAKSRLNALDKPILADEEIFDLATGQGSFSYILDKIKAAYAVQV